MKRKSLFIGIFVSAGMLAYIFVGIDWAQFLREISHVNLFVLPLILLSLLISWALRVPRWRVFLPGGRKLSFVILFDSWVLSLFATFLLPFRAGEFVRPILLKREGLSYSAGFASIVAERAFDVLALVILLAASAREFQAAPPMLRYGLQSLSVIAVLIFAAMLLATRKPKVFRRLFELLEAFILRGKFPKLKSSMEFHLDEFVLGLSVLKSPRAVVSAVAWSLVIWVSMGLYFQLCLIAFGIHASLWMGIVVNLVVALLVAAPSAPGFLGTFQLGCVIALCSMYGLPRDLGVAFSIISHVIQYLVVIAAGFFVLAKYGLKLSQLSSYSAQHMDESSSRD